MELGPIEPTPVSGWLILIGPYMNTEYVNRSTVSDALSSNMLSSSSVLIPVAIEDVARPPAVCGQSETTWGQQLLTVWPRGLLHYEYDEPI